jgi:dienelactone hydrolase
MTIKLKASSVLLLCLALALFSACSTTGPPTMPAVDTHPTTDPQDSMPVKTLMATPQTAGKVEAEGIPITTPAIPTSPVPSPQIPGIIIDPATPVTFRNTNAPSGAEHLAASWIEVDTFAGKKILAGVWQPAGPGPFPVLVYLHGTAGLISYDYQYAADVSQGGFIVVVGIWWGGRPAVIEERFPAAQMPGLIISPEGPELTGASLEAVRDVIPLLRVAQQLPGADPERVGVFGHSRGGTLALLVASKVPEVRAVVASGAIYTYAGNQWLAYPPRGRLPEIPPITLAGEMRVPLLMLHGTLDERVEVQQARDYEQALRDRNKVFEVQYYEGAPHGLPYESATEKDVGARTIDFFRRHLKQ